MGLFGRHGRVFAHPDGTLIAEWDCDVSPLPLASFKITTQAFEFRAFLTEGGVGEAVCDHLQRNLGLRFIRYRLVRGTSETRQARRNFTVPRIRMFEMLYMAGEFPFHVTPVNRVGFLKSAREGGTMEVTSRWPL